jgi:hypothetical protein
MTWEKLFPQASGLGLNWKVAECAFDQESGVVRWRIEETEHFWKAQHIRLHKNILRKNQTSASESDAGGVPVCRRWSSVSDTTGFVPTLHSTPAGVQAARPPDESPPKRNFMQP